MSERSEWRPIEEAPRDGTAILAYTSQRRGYVSRQDVQIVHWTEWGGGVWENVSGMKPTCVFTHFMPLPDPPADEFVTIPRMEE